MNDTERVLGRLEEFKEWMSKEMHILRAEVKELNRVRWQIIGGSTVISVLVSAIGVLLKK